MEKRLKIVIENELFFNIDQKCIKKGIDFSNDFLKVFVRVLGKILGVVLIKNYKKSM